MGADRIQHSPNLTFNELNLPKQSLIKKNSGGGIIYRPLFNPQFIQNFGSKYCGYLKCMYLIFLYIVIFYTLDNKGILAKEIKILNI